VSYRTLLVLTVLVLAAVFLSGQQMRAVARARGLGAGIGVGSTVSLSSTSSTSSTSLGLFASTTTTTVASVLCGDATSDGSVTATDALVALTAAIGLQSCALCLCDMDGSGAVTATDALMLLQVAVGQVIAPQCPPC